MDEDRIHVGILQLASRPGKVELIALFESLLDGGSYSPSTGIPMGLNFMLNRGDRPRPDEEFRGNVARWLTMLHEDPSGVASQVFNVWQVLFERHNRREAPLRQYLERVLYLLAKDGNSSAVELAAERRKRYREWLTVQKSLWNPGA